MKLRIKGNSLRIRLTKTEVDNFGKNGLLEEQTRFGNEVFTYALQSRAADGGLAASMEKNKITMWVPEKIKEEWVNTDVVGFQNKMDIGNGEQLFLLLEKDFVCIDNTFEDQSDNYPNPNALC